MWFFEFDGSGKGEWSIMQLFNFLVYNNIFCYVGVVSVVCGGKVYLIGGFGIVVFDDQLDNGSEIFVFGMIIVELEM